MEYVAVVGVEAMMAAMVSKVENVVTKYLEEIFKKRRLKYKGMAG